MSYGDESFWAKYVAYVTESLPRHKAAIERLGGLLAPLLDLGCGKVMEGRQIAIGKDEKHYIGVDVDPIELDPLRPRPIPDEPALLTKNYRTDLGFIASNLKARKFSPFCVVSLFSIEPTGSPEENELVYREVFKRWPTVRKIISAGFYYQKTWNVSGPVPEAGGLMSYQLNGEVPLLSGDLHEYRLEEHAPSTLFGPDVVEVWRLIQKKEKTK
jgi:hypothetical protein